MQALFSRALTTVGRNGVSPSRQRRRGLFATVTDPNLRGAYVLHYVVLRKWIGGLSGPPFFLAEARRPYAKQLANVGADSLTAGTIRRSRQRAKRGADGRSQLLQLSLEARGQFLARQVSKHSEISLRDSTCGLRATQPGLPTSWSWGRYLRRSIRTEVQQAQSQKRCGISRILPVSTY